MEFLHYIGGYFRFSSEKSLHKKCVQGEKIAGFVQHGILTLHWGDIPDLVPKLAFTKMCSRGKFVALSVKLFFDLIKFGSFMDYLLTVIGLLISY